MFGKASLSPSLQARHHPQPLWPRALHSSHQGATALLWPCSLADQVDGSRSSSSQRQQTEDKMSPLSQGWGSFAWEAAGGAHRSSGNPVRPATAPVPVQLLHPDPACLQHEALLPSPALLLLNAFGLPTERTLVLCCALRNHSQKSWHD